MNVDLETRVDTVGDILLVICVVALEVLASKRPVLAHCRVS